MTLLLGDIVPNFTADSTIGTINFHEWLGESWGFFFSHPADFTPVCTTELGRTSQLSAQFAERNVKSVGLSTDTSEQHLAWLKDVNETQNTCVEFPVIADTDLTVAKLYGMLHPEQSATATVRSVFIIDPNKKLRLTMTYPMTVGRNFNEILRVIDSLQTGDANSIATPADWQPGDLAIIPPSISNEEADKKFPQGYEVIKPYLRTVKI